MPKIVLVGPVAPYRGGVAQYNTKMHDVLSSHYETKTYSFKRQYPLWLYPGSGDKEDNTDERSDIAYTIDVYSPLSLGRTLRKIISDKPDVVLLTWWTFFWQPGLGYIAKALRKKGIKVVYICHNVYDHDANSVKKRISNHYLVRADGYIVHASEEEQLIKNITKDGKVLNLGSLPIEEHTYLPEKKQTPRGRLEILFFGFIRPYKGLDTLIDALAALDDHNIYATIAGESWVDKETLRKQIIEKGIPNLELNLSYVDDLTASRYFSRADLIVLPYKSATGSAVASQAYKHGKPILGTSVGGLGEVVKEGVTGWLVPPDSPRKLASVLQKITRKESAGMKPAIEEFCDKHSWEHTAEKVISFSVGL